ncbi:MAG TPA: ribonuclease HII [Thermofilum sp.]|nr:ribonuclease HII [Thermofilum sp.]
MLLGGIDEAGRGPAIGPMIVSLAVMDEENIKKLKLMGVKDSKALTPKSRSRLFKLIIQDALEIVVRIVSPKEIDDAVLGRNFTNLNELEAYMAAEVLSKARSLRMLSTIYLDSPDPNPQRYLKTVKRFLRSMGVSSELSMIAENHADEKFPIVSIASIVSKVVRDDVISRLKEEYGDFGSGYPSDPKTRNFIREWLSRNKSPPPIARKSWKSWKRH